MPQQRIIAFAKDWNDVPTSVTHIMREQAKTRPVLWINSIGARKPHPGHKGDITRVLRRLADLFRPAKLVENNLRVKSLCLIPGARSRAARWLNRKLFLLQAARDLTAMGKAPIEYWCAVPNAIDLIPERAAHPPTSHITHHTSQAAVIYFCVDDWGKFQNLDGQWLENKESELLKRADIVFSPAKHLADKCRDVLARNGRADAANIVHCIPHGVEYSKFATALDEHTVIPKDIAELTRPVIGFYGNIYPWIDFELIEQLASSCPDYSFVLIGQAYCDVSRLRKHENIHLPGRREHDDLPAYCKGFDAAIIPYDTSDLRMQSVNPVKAKEMLAAGVPIVASDLPELKDMAGVTIADGIDEWIDSLRHEVKRKDRKAISETVINEDWSEKVAKMRRIVERQVRSWKSVGR